ncbi:MAG: glycosyltransferase family 9 protein [Rhodocyclaceae bacterium]|nr:glycosyltransferase family 9 protein [Rhodocyclaceae bacterium]
MRIRPIDFLLRSLLRLLGALDRRDRGLGSIEPDKVRCVLLIASTALGDTVLSTAAFAPVRERFPKARIIALINTQYVPLFRNCREIDAAIPYWGGYQRFMRTLLQLRRCRPDLALVLHGNEPQATPLAYLAGARWIVKLPNANAFRFLLSNREPLVQWQAFRHALDQRLGVAALVGANIAAARMRLPQVPGAPAAVDSLLAGGQIAGRRLVGFQCGASSRSRMWPADHFVELGRRLLAEFADVAIVLTGSPDEAPYLDDIARRIGGPTFVAAGRVELALLPELVGRFATLVTGDTGTLHIAVAAGTPIVGLFAVSTPSASGPAYDLDRHVIIHRPCPDHFVRTKSDDQTCIARIAVDEVHAAVAAILRRPSGPGGQA